MSTATPALGRVENGMAHIVQDALSWAAGDVDSAVAEARRCKTIRQWHKQLQRRIGGTAFGTSLIPGLHGFGIGLELPCLFTLMARGAIGTGALLGAAIDAETDLLAIFGLWSGAIHKNTLAAAQGGAVFVNYEGGAIITSSLAHPAYGAKVLALGLKLGVQAVSADLGGVAGKVAGSSAGPVSVMMQPAIRTLLAKISAKASGQIGAKVAAGFAPVLGAAISGGISYHVLAKFFAAAKSYYEHKIVDTSTPV